MKLTLDLILDAGDSTLDSTSFLKQIGTYRGEVSDISTLEGRVAVTLDGEDLCGEYSDPIVRLVHQWLSKLPWIIGGDTETVALRNSETCFAFVPAGESVELSYFQGDETEIEEYMVEPVTLRLDLFVTEAIKMGDRLVEIVEGVDAALMSSNEDCKDLATSLSEGKRAWRDYQLHNRR